MSRKILTVVVLCALLLIVAAEYVIFAGIQRANSDSVRFSYLWQYVGMVQLTGADAWAACAAVGIPCPSNPIFPAKEYVKGFETAYVVETHVCEVPNGGSNLQPTRCTTITIVLLDSAAYCTTAQVPWLKQCPTAIS